MLRYLTHGWRVLQRRKNQAFKPVVLITGCGSGIGLALAQLLSTQTQYRVIITAREESLPFLRRRFKDSERFWMRKLDVTSKADRQNLMREIRTRWGAVNILINNAGIAYRAVLEHMTDADEKKQITTNYLGPAALIRAVLPGMRKLGRGKIINVSSVSGMLAMPTMASYSASKYALEGMSEALWYETRPLGINICLIQPGFVRSNSFRRVHYTRKSAPNAKRSNKTYMDYYANMAPFIERLMNWSRATPESIANKILGVIQTEDPPLWVPVTLDAVVFYYLRRLLPRRLLLPILFAALPGARRWAMAYTNCRYRQLPRGEAA